ncbi:MAG: TIGR02099 family protein [Metallibacterium scheffleri]|uniref:YhdP family protein n=1 Tax=Metallibacterium scheffleri TaxID=993689 RepID=UPI0026ECC50F|nr:YhdP family protein [Metallibacterium scheffleri]MCK9366347.1 TIGR02099 family protein [Metallibacterium scheffleri]
MTPKPRHRSWHRRLRFWLGAVVAAVVITLATAMALGQILLPLAARYPQRVEALLTRELGRPVRFQSMHGIWRPGGPELTLSHLTLGARTGAPLLRLAEAKLRFSFGRLFWPDRHWIELSARGLDLQLARDAAGSWHVAGFGGAAGSGGQNLYSLPVDLKLTDLRVEVQPGPAAPRYGFTADAVLISDRDDALRFGANLRRDGMTHDVHVAGRFSANGHAGALYVDMANADLGQLARDVLVSGYALTRGHGSVRAWLHWRDGRLQQAQVEFDVADVALSGAQARAAQISRLTGTLDVRRDGALWRLRYATPAPRGQAPGLVQAVFARHAGEPWLRVQAEALQLAPLAPLAGLLPQTPPSLSQWLGVAALQGRIDHADLRWYGPRAYSFVGAVHDLGWAPTGSLPGIDQLDAVARGDQEAIALEVPRQSLTLRYPHVFRSPFAFTALSATLAAWHSAAGWKVGIGALDFDAAQFAGSADGTILLRPGQAKPVLDVYAALRRADVAAAKLFWPINIMSPKGVAWLDRALVNGSVERARAVFRGDTADWPFHDDQGQFQALARFREVGLDFDPHWPQAVDLAGSALFENAGLTVNATQGSVLGNPLRHALARISDLGEITLALSANGTGQAPQLLDFVRKSPISNHFRDAIKPLRISGSAGWSFTLVLPLHDVHQFALDGTAQLRQVGVEAPEWQLAIRKINGPMQFNRGGISASGLTAEFRGTPAMLTIAAGSDTGVRGRALQASLAGQFDAATLLRGIAALQVYVPRLQGSAPVTLGLRIDTGNGSGGSSDNATRNARMVSTTMPVSSGGAATRTLSVDSTLVGMRLDLPAPLDKPAASSLPLHLEIGLPFAGARLRGTLGGEMLSANGRLPAAAGQGFALSLGLGGTPPPPLPTGAAGGLALAGSAPRLDVSGWSAISAGNSSGARWPLSGGVQTPDALLFGRVFKDLQLQLHSSAQGLQVRASSPALDGSLSLPDDVQRAGITANLKRLYWPAEGAGSGPGTPAAAAPMAAVNPASLPPLHLRVDDFHLGAAQFGSANFQSTPIAGGLRIDQLDSHSPNVSMRAQGTWMGDARNNRTQMNIEFSAADLGHMLEALGYQNLVAGGRTVAHLDASWAGAPSAFALDALDGTLKIAVTEGRILEVKPGAGRLLGLFSIAELPRRLMFDFGDVFRKGLAFDSIRGDFTLGNGNAVTHDLEIRGPAADIKVDGRTGLRAHDYDQIVSVSPKVGSTLPLLGAVAGGPVGAAAGLALQGLLGSGLAHASATTYKITGSWEKPLIVKINPAPAGSTARPPPAH